VRPTEGEKLALKEFPPLSERGVGQVPRLGVVEVRLDSGRNRGNVRLDDADLPRGLPAMDQGRRGSSCACSGTA
jgi:hypothetical protein